MEKMKAVAKSAFGFSAVSIVAMLFFGSSAYFSHGLAREVMIWMAVVMTPLAMLSGMISGYALEHAKVLQRITALRSDISLLNQAINLTDSELEQLVRNRFRIIMSHGGQRQEVEMRQRSVADIRQDIEREFNALAKELDADLMIPKPFLVAWWERNIQSQMAY